MAYRWLAPVIKRVHDIEKAAQNMYIFVSSLVLTSCLFVRSGSLSQSVVPIFFTLFSSMHCPPLCLVWLILSLSVSLFVCSSVSVCTFLSVCLLVYLYVCLHLSCLSVRLSVCLSVRLCLFVCLSVFYSSHFAQFLHFNIHSFPVALCHCYYRHFNFFPLSQVILWLPKPMTVPRPTLHPASCYCGVENAITVTTAW